MCSGSICHPTAIHLITTISGTFSLTATPTTRSVSQGTGAVYTINVASANGFNGTVGFAQSILPACVTPSYPAPVPAPGSAILVLGTANCAPGTYPVTIVGNSGPSVPVTLVVQGPPAPANIIAPSTGSTLSDASPIFTWDSGSQVTQYQLDVAATDSPSCSTRYLGSSQSAAMALAPCCTRQRPLLATLTSTFASGGSQAQSYSYTCGPVTGPDFSLTVPASVTVDAGFQASFLANIVPSAGFASSVRWAFTPSDPGLTAVWAANSQPSLSATTATATVTAAASLL